MITGKAVSTLYQFLVSHLIENHLDVAAFKEDGRFIPTIAFYSPNALGAITKALHSDNYSFKMYIMNYQRIIWMSGDVDAPSYWYKNINYQHDLDALIQKL